MTEEISILEFQMQKIANDIDSGYVSDPRVAQLLDALSIAIVYLKHGNQFELAKKEIGEVFK
ncbi:MAG TPA: hypothetical protein VJN02_04020 [Gammaproteobacteria bacterium]|nr:hypothetical protein [Gammaproteobacteria bacterium]